MPGIDGPTVQAGDPVQIQESDLVFGTDPDSNQSDFSFYRRLGATHLDMNPLTQERMQKIAIFLWRRNPYAHRILKLIADMAIGGEVRFTSENKKVQKILTEHWNHPINNWDWRIHQLTFELGLYGEIFQTANVIDPDRLGDVTWGIVDPLRVKKVTSDERDLSQPAIAHVVTGDVQSGTSAQGDTTPLDIIRWDGKPDSDTHGFREGEILFTKINGLLGALRGMSDLFPLADYLDFIDQFMFSLQQRANLQNTFVWDVELAGKSDQDIQNWLAGNNGKPPGPGSIRAHNERVTWQAITPALAASDAGEHLKISRNYVLSGAGLTDWMMGEMGGANRAGTESSAAVVAKTMEQRQREVKQMLEDVFNFVIDKKIQAGQLPSRKFDRTFYITLPKIAIRDVGRLANAFRQAAQGIETLRNLKAIDPERMIALTNELINMLDLEGSNRFLEKDPDRAKDMIDQIEKMEKDEAKAERKRANEPVRSNGANPDVPPVPPVAKTPKRRAGSGKSGS